MVNFNLINESSLSQHFIITEKKHCDKQIKLVVDSSILTVSLKYLIKNLQRLILANLGYELSIL